MIKLLEGGAYLLNGCEIIADCGDALNEVKAKTGKDVSKENIMKNIEKLLQQQKIQGQVKRMLSQYRTIYSGGEAEIIEKKSRFIATVKPVKTEENLDICLRMMQQIS